MTWFLFVLINQAKYYAQDTGNQYSIFGSLDLFTGLELTPIKNYKEFLKDKNVLLMYTTVLSAYKYTPNLESLLTQQYVCVMCTL
jgi:hypothetical protein